MMASSFKKSLQTIRKLTEDYQPDILVNFYEPLVGAYALLYKPSFKIISIAHQYTYLHPSHRFPPGHRFQSLLTYLYTRFSVAGSKKILAISMRETEAPASKKLVIIPPILRKELFLQEKKQEDFILVYLLNSGYIADILKWHKKHPKTVLRCFTDSAEVKNDHRGEWKIDDHLVFYSLNDHKFLEMMASCRGLICNAGFESVCEALYLEKPVMMVPVKGHFEQFCNARDVAKSGAGISSDEFNLAKMEHYLLFHQRHNGEPYQQWVNRMEEILLKEIKTLLPATAKDHPSDRIQEVRHYYIDQLTDPSFSSFRDMPKA